MSVELSLSAKKRADVGKGASRRLRRLEDVVPGIVYGGGKEPVMIAVEHRFMKKALENKAFYSQLITLDLDGDKLSVVLKDLQRHPYKPKILHLDLMRVSATEKLTMHVPLRFIGEDIAPGVKLSGGVVSHLMADVEVLCLPKDLPEYIEVDLSNLALDHAIHLTELKLPAGVQLAALTHGHIEEHDQAVVSIHAPRAASAADDNAAPAVAASEVPAANDKSGKSA